MGEKLYAITPKDNRLTIQCGLLDIRSYKFENMITISQNRSFNPTGAPRSFLWFKKKYLKCNNVYSWDILPNFKYRHNYFVAWKSTMLLSAYMTQMVLRPCGAINHLEHLVIQKDTLSTNMQIVRILQSTAENMHCLAPKILLINTSKDSKLTLTAYY